MPRRLGLVLHVLGTAGGSAWIATHVDLGQAIAMFAIAAVIVALNVAVGAVAGDVGRGAVSHAASETEGAVGALPVVLVERAHGRRLNK